MCRRKGQCSIGPQGTISDSWARNELKTEVRKAETSREKEALVLGFSLVQF